MNAETCRRFIGVEAPFDLSKLRSGYLKQIRENHPDRFFGDATRYAAATEKTRQLIQSFQFLSELLEEIGGTYSITQTAAAEPASGTKGQPYRPKYTYEGESYAKGFPDDSITEIFVKSSHIISTGYDRAKRMLYIKFKGNRVYRYFDVPESIFDDFLAAESQGKFGHKYIYKSFRYEQC